MSSDEQQPLLDTPRKPRTPLPKAQLAVVYAIKITLPIAQTQVLPYFNVFIQNLAASEGADTGYYSGLAHSVYYGAQLVSMFIWGRLSDSIGRVPVLAIGTSGTALFSVLFGFSGSLSGVLINRLLAGFFYGITGAIHSVVGELSDDTNKSIAFPLYDVVSAVAYVIGPLIGGALESPADKWPDTFSSPCGAPIRIFFPAWSLLFCPQRHHFWLYSLSESKKKPEAIPPSELDALLSPSTSPVPNNQPAAAEPMSVKELISIPVFPIQIGSSLSAMGFVSIFLKLLLPPVLRARGTLSVFAWCMRVWPLAFAALPLAAWAARVGTAETKWTMVAGALFLSRLGCMAFGVVMILTRDYTPGSASLGTSNGIAEERRPLLESERKRVNPLPKSQFLVICAIKLTLPVALTQVLPYVNVFIGKLAASAGADTGYYSGWATSTFHAAQFVGMFVWGRTSDKIGRIPVIALGTSGTAFFTLLLAFSGSLSTLLVNRLLAGFVYGITGAIHSVVGEISDETNQTLAFLLYDIVSAVGFTMGPLIGGSLESPADKWPALFSSPLWCTYPYLLPCLVSALLSVGGALLAVLVLNETLPSKRTPTKPSATSPSDPEAPLLPVPSVPPAEPLGPLTVPQLLSIPALRAVFAANGVLAFFGASFTTVFVLMAYSPLADGGLALSPSEIGHALSAMGLASIPLKLSLPPVLRARGPRATLAATMYAWPLTFAALPLAALAARSSSTGRGETWAAVAAALFFSRLGCLAFSIVMILTKDHTPGSASLGTANGIAELLQSLAATAGPVVVSPLFALSASRHLLGGYLWVVAMLFACALGSRSHTG
ncbi:major facilitator superfamily domain-containing protein [Epithele typhae]|uniref:major facilitator superfamily domain-containing protein n=1 Tax=Epithele typhae TaxID=378194 RepID=UPI002007FB58|nr:major facilitator superfamily domain-containing protein [Epithele typhae]KAH9942402.1 major facilitator superfamily domain-containing protein [Epithele typhae]